VVYVMNTAAAAMDEAVYTVDEVVTGMVNGGWDKTARSRNVFGGGGGKGAERGD
jgi:hypothetical protein